VKKDDWTGVSISLGIHVVVLLMLSILTAASSEDQPMGFLEVEFGAFSEGSPVQQAPVREEVETPEVEERPDTEERPPVAPPEDVKPVELPDAELTIPDEEVIDVPQSETIAPEESLVEEEIVAEDPEPEREVVQPLGSGSLSADEGENTNDDGESNEEEASAPYQIEGLNREPFSTPIPAYSAQVNALIRVRITVDPSGRIIQRIPLIKGDPVLEREVMNALLRWRFNPLPVDAPQENQTGVVSFRFRLQ